MQVQIIIELGLGDAYAYETEPKNRLFRISHILKHMAHDLESSLQPEYRNTDGKRVAWMEIVDS